MYVQKGLMMGKLKKAVKRIYRDYLMGSKLKIYKTHLKKILDAGYKIIPCKDLFNVSDNEKVCILRHDIDTDVKIAKKMFDIEKSLGISSTYYFRLSTLNKKVIDYIKQNDKNTEVSYHFEEISTFAKEQGINSKDEIDKNLDVIRENFKKNLSFVRENYDIECSTIASHGDFVNRKIGIINNYFLNEDLRKELNISLEAYDNELMINAVYISDGKFDLLQKNNKTVIEESIEQQKNKLYMLVHPRTWSSAPIERLKVDLKRYKEGKSYDKKIKKNDKCHKTGKETR